MIKQFYFDHTLNFIFLIVQRVVFVLNLATKAELFTLPLQVGMWRVESGDHTVQHFFF